MSLKNFGHSPTEVRAMLDKYGLRAPSTHVGTETLDNVDAFVDEAKILGHKYLILADVPASGRQSLATFAAFADRLNRAGEQARKHDLWIAWHDEADDFKSFGGQQGYEALRRSLLLVPHQGRTVDPRRARRGARQGHRQPRRHPRAREEPGRQVLLRRAGDVSGHAAGECEAGLCVHLAAQV